MKEIDPNAIIAELVSQFSHSVFERAKSLGSDSIDRLKVNLNLSLTKHIERNYERYSKIKTLLYREKPVNLKDFYVRTDLMLENTTVDEKTFLEEINKKKRIIVSGTAGSGKSTFCKSIFIEIIEKSCGLIPIFIELRHLNQEKESTILDSITAQLSEIEPTFSATQLDYALKLGKILLILDGFDEINSEIRETYEKHITALAGKYSGIKIIVSSRPDVRLSSWDEFYVYRICPLDKEKAKRLIGNLEYDTSVKEKFLEELDKNLYERHKSFAENPLLLTMMLLTYEQIAEIPNKIHLFYEQAFLTLFNKHDSLKSLYKRKSFSGLPIDEFIKILSSFCILSYSDRKYYFSETEISDYVKKSIKMNNSRSSAENFIKDLLDSVCLMQRDGLGYAFTHRSFQEYFTAIFLVTFSNQNKFAIFEKIAFTNEIDDVIPMAHDINSDLVEQEWIIPKLEIIALEFDMILESQDGKLKALSKMYRSIISPYKSEKENDTRSLGFCFYMEQEKRNTAYFQHLIQRIYLKDARKFFKKLKQKSDTSKKFEQELIRIDLKNSENNELIIENIEALKKSTKQRLIKSGCCDHVLYRISFLQERLRELKTKHTQKQKNITDLLLG